MVSHGAITHSFEETTDCPTCQKAMKSFEKAKKDGTLDKILKEPQPEWAKEYYEKFGGLLDLISNEKSE